MDFLKSREGAVFSDLQFRYITAALRLALRLFQSRGRAGTLTLLLSARTDARARLSGHSRPIRPSVAVYVAQGTGIIIT